MQDSLTRAPDTLPKSLPGQVPARLSALSFLICLSLSVGIFLIFNPLWRAVEIGELDRGILWSYGVLPLLVGLSLQVEGKLSRAPWFLETLKLTFVKFTLTYALASVGWVLVGPPLAEKPAELAALASGHEPSFQPMEAPAASVIEPGKRTTLHGSVLDAVGNPLAGVLVYVESGLAQYRFNPPSAALELQFGVRGCTPGLGVLQSYQSLLLRSVDTQLHTVQLSRPGGRSLLNHPSTPGSERHLMFKHALGVLRLSCRVHGELEPTSHLLVTDNPFHGYTTASGEFTLPGVPEGELVLATWSLEHGALRQEIDLASTLPVGGLALRYP